MEKINIFYLVPTLEVGGSEWMAYLLAKGLNRGRYNSIVGYYFWSGVLEDLLRSKGIEVINIGPGRNKISRLDRFRSTLKLSKFLRERKIKIIHTFQFDIDILGAIAARLAGRAKAIFHQRHPELKEGFSSVSKFNLKGMVKILIWKLPLFVTRFLPQKYLYRSYEYMILRYTERGYQKWLK